MTPEEKARFMELSKIIDNMGPVADMGHRYGLNLTAAVELVGLLRKQIGELQGDLAEYLDDAFRHAAERTTSGELTGWWDTLAKSSAKMYGDRLVEMKSWERHPEGAGNRWWYRPSEATKGTD